MTLPVCENKLKKIPQSIDLYKHKLCYSKVSDKQAQVGL